jgi:hypothetical protein
VLYQLPYIPYTPKLGDIQNMKVGNLQHPFILQAIQVNMFSQKTGYFRWNILFKK